MRIISGKFRGRKILTYDSKSMRPTMSKAKEALFNILTHGGFGKDNANIINDSVVLDLYCGCGSLGLEAMSRGAKQAIFIDIDKNHLEVVEENAKNFGIIDHVSLIRADSSIPPQSHFACDLVFLDPPYNSGLIKKTLKNLINSGWLKEGSILVVESPKQEDLVLPEAFELIEQRKYGNCKISILKTQGV